MRTTHRALAMTAVAALTLAACGDPDTTSPAAPVTVPDTDPGTTAPDTPITGPTPTDPVGEPDTDEAVRRAASLLGTLGAELPDDVRIARRGDEEFPLTADHVPGRLTVELDADEEAGTGDMVVTSVTVETEDSSQVITTDTILQGAASALGTAEEALDPSWRIGRRGDEQYALTDDFVVGRYTVELDDDGTGTFVVSHVQIELPNGVETISAP